MKLEEVTWVIYDRPLGAAKSDLQKERICFVLGVALDCNNPHFYISLY